MSAEQQAMKNFRMTMTDIVVTIGGSTFDTARKQPINGSRSTMDDLYTYQIWSANEEDLYTMMKGLKYANE